MTALNLIPGQLSLAQLRDVYQNPVKLTLDNSASAQIEASVACVEQILAENRTAYGINTGFGLLASTRIASEDLENLQRSLVLSHAAGVGQPISDELVRLIMVLKVNSLSRGFSGIRRKVIDALIALINAEVCDQNVSEVASTSAAAAATTRTCPIARATAYSAPTASAAASAENRFMRQAGVPPSGSWLHSQPMIV